jgi:hypothetical protein
MRTIASIFQGGWYYCELIARNISISSCTSEILFHLIGSLILFSFENLFATHIIKGIDIWSGHRHKQHTNWIHFNKEM